MCKHTCLRLLLIPCRCWLLVKESASLFEWSCDGLLPRGHCPLNAMNKCGLYKKRERGKIREMRVMVVGRSLLFIETPYLIKLKGRRLHQSTCCTLPHNTTLLPYTWYLFHLIVLLFIAKWTPPLSNKLTYGLFILLQPLLLQPFFLTFSPSSLPNCIFSTCHSLLLTFLFSSRHKCFALQTFLCVLVVWKLVILFVFSVV